MLQKIESFLVQLVRGALLLLSLALIAGLLWWGVDAARSAIQGPERWQQIKVDSEAIKSQMRRGLGMEAGEPDYLPARSASDAQLATAYTQIDRILRRFIEAQPLRRAQIEQDHGASGLLPWPESASSKMATPDVPNPNEVADRQVPAAASTIEPAPATTKPAAAAPAAFVDVASARILMLPVDISKMVDERATLAEMEFGGASYKAYVLGLPAALTAVLKDKPMRERLYTQPSNVIVSSLLNHYGISFDTEAAAAARAQQNHGVQAFVARWATASNVLLASSVIWFLIVAVLVIVFLRIERHLRSLGLMKHMAQLELLAVPAAPVAVADDSGPHDLGSIEAAATPAVTEGTMANAKADPELSDFDDPAVKAERERLAAEVARFISNEAAVGSGPSEPLGAAPATGGDASLSPNIPKIASQAPPDYAQVGKAAASAAASWGAVPITPRQSETAAPPKAYSDADDIPDESAPDPLAPQVSFPPEESSASTRSFPPDFPKVPARFAPPKPADSEEK